MTRRDAAKAPADAPTTGRFAPSPTGLLHLGHAYSALLAHDSRRAEGGRFLLRLEDIDPQRCRPEFETAILEDLTWLGVRWDATPRRQSEHWADYRAALARLDEAGLLYRCFCTRSEIAAEVARSPSAPHGPEGAPYPGLCKRLDPAEVADRLAKGDAYALRLDTAKALARCGPLVWHDAEAGAVVARPDLFGDVVLARKDTPTSYHLAVTVDDALQQITHVVRGRDLFEATHVHRLLQALLALPSPLYRHHALLKGADGKRYAKRDRSLTLASLRATGETPATLRQRIGLPAV
ncbi:glutamyl-tRNA synthetase, class Ic [Rhodospirillum rubrum F11]|uniref:Glutamyl-tRNA synthetase, class Ic n=2 Tax=Rhodospirillum rubrum TaxID=1085 RepID=Q2RMW7_RHORT|nr:tRNA glutamyl-Q(34) synthetase GluQRS [Rhodospirillum rubrum]ABC24528.1 Glutamyl-tRNA synthetase, class Ic [Rhodospirillum rubrum ATCC 11170]AEO50280.1 glutamyl-tRNA synthetase, class Ic [Rhodospirillum rubrum F11]MBK5956253.1 tRNA glutamyl-Q(34) synthetase GluQRS [Rhodospirillum rubrum]QXG80445.1 tRNA glutamyl-Q(34) synthetase GluQRS [Rhodospirillum rubrum]